MQTVDVEIRPVSASDIALLEKDMPWGGPAKHRARLERQATGEAVYLIALDGGRPVGHVLLRWGGVQPLGSRFEKMPAIVDLLVHPDHRSRGIGSGLMGAAEGLARGRGYAWIGLGVGVDNSRAQALYRRLGYADTGLAPHREGGSYVDEHGEQRAWEETCVYLYKQLD